MDKKEAELEAIRRAKSAQVAAGKSSGMSGRDLVSLVMQFWFSHSSSIFSSPIIRSGLISTKVKRKRKRIGTLASIGGKKRKEVLLTTSMIKIVKIRLFIHYQCHFEHYKKALFLITIIST
jgi:hypothetical protein